MYRDPPPDGRSIVVLAFEGHVAGVDRATGVRLWRNDLLGAAGGPVALAIEGGRVYVTTAGWFLACLDYATGATLWTAPTGSGGAGTLLIDGEQVFVVKGGSIDCVDLRGRVLWRRALSDPRGAFGLPGNVRAVAPRGGDEG